MCVQYAQFSGKCKFEINDKVCKIGNKDDIYQVWDIFTIYALRGNVLKFLVRIIDIDGDYYEDVPEEALEIYI